MWSCRRGRLGDLELDLQRVNYQCDERPRAEGYADAFGGVFRGSGGQYPLDWVFRVANGFAD